MKKIIFLHHSTGRSIWIGGTNELAYKLGRKGTVQKFFEDYNRENNTDYIVTSQIFPKKEPYGWKNYPFDYYNIWVKNGGNESYMEEPTLESLTREYDVIVFKHCFPVGRILEDTGIPDVNSEEKRLENYKAQYNALKKKMQSFPATKFIIWTPPALLKDKTTPGQALRTYEFYTWMLDKWDEPGDNIYIWDLYKHQTEGGLYLLEKNAAGPGDSHPGRAFAEKMAPLFSRFIIDVIEQDYNSQLKKNEHQQLYTEHSDSNP